MEATIKKTCLSDSLESQKKIANEIANGLLEREIVAEGKQGVSQSEVLKAKARGRSFVKKYGL